MSAEFRVESGEWTTALLRHLLGRGIRSTAGCLILIHVWIHRRVAFADLGGVTGLTQGSLTGAVRVLYEKGLIHRLYDTADRRTLFIGLSAAGRHLIDSAISGEHPISHAA